MKKIKILGINIDNITFKGAVNKIDSFLKSSKSHQVVTINPEFIMSAQKDRKFAKVLNSAHLSVPDGSGLVWASQFLYKSKNTIKEKVAGIDLVWAIAKLAAEKDYSIYFLGGTPGVAEKTAFILKKIHPKLKIAGNSVGEWTKGRSGLVKEKVTKNIKKSKADILFVAYGAPRQDIFIANNLEKFGTKVAMGVGGSFDFISGTAQRAPKWMQKNFEWFWRLLKEPWRFKRIYTAVIKFPVKVFFKKTFS